MVNISFNAPPILDDAWWDSLLTAEERYCLQEDLSIFDKASVPQDGEREIDWALVTQAFENDQIVSAQVMGYNQGGLLVQGSGLHGFIPISHLVNTCQNEQFNNAAALPADLLKPLLGNYMGRILRLKVIECDPARGRIVLSERAAQTAPGRRNELMQQLACGQTTQGTVTNITDFGVFVDLGGLEGLIHISELSWGRVHHPADVVKLGQMLKVHVLQLDRERCRIGLSLKRLYANPWEIAAQRYEVGATVQVTITGVVSYGAFARVEDGLDGLIHVSNMPDGALRQRVHVGQKLKARIVHIDPQRQRLGLCLEAELA
ncbi:MAG: hypothetical protein OHK0052_02930 [Anaerolineales bacterium]